MDPLTCIGSFVLYVPPARRRAAVIILQGDKVALIRREHATGKVYYLFPGGHVEQGESIEEAAQRETREELGLVVTLGSLVAIVEHGGSEQFYYLAEVVSGVFGSGNGPEMKSLRRSESGSHSPEWIDLVQLAANDVRPRGLAHALSAGLPRQGLPLRIKD